jgi:DNA-3-methyladenine glycosylase II
MIVFNKENFYALCDKLARKDRHLKKIIRHYGYPPMWQRKPNFETLVHIILEQQVSLASAKAALNKLKEKIGIITPKKILLLTDAEMKACYFSRQKIIYARHLAQSIENGELSIRKMKTLSDDVIRQELKKIKGIGDWTVDIFLLMALQRSDVFPVGDLSVINSLKKVKQLAHVSKEDLLLLTESWKPHRSIAAMILWHSYIRERNIKI